MRHCSERKAHRPPDAVGSSNEVPGRVALAPLVEVPKFLPNFLVLLLVETSSIFDHKRPLRMGVSP